MLSNTNLASRCATFTALNKISKLIITLPLMALTAPLMAQISFTEVTDITDSLTAATYSSAAWGDYDNDGDLDILIVGGASTVYRNEGSDVFVDIEAGLEAVGNATGTSASWGDYDNDGDLDILLTGWSWNTTNDNILRVYNNDEGSFTDINVGITGLAYSTAAWGDYDNDGDLDILYVGSSQGLIYQNDDGIFASTSAYFSTYQYNTSAGTWADYDNDGDLDVLVSDWSGGTKIYANTGGTFPSYDNPTVALAGVWDAAAAWGDYNNDGYLDVILTGFDGNLTRYTILYENSASGVFDSHYLNETGLEGVQDASVAWGDYDNDGDLDLLLSGWTGSTTFTRVYTNNGDDTFTDFAGAVLPAISPGSAVWGDYDDDGDLDILVTGTGNAKVYENDSGTANTAPTAPTGLQADVIQDMDKVSLTWSIATDIDGGAGGLSYNLRVGTTPGAEDILSPQANTTTGYRLIPALGNAQENLYGWDLNNLPDGTIYWSVQSIDQAWAGSPFAAEETFEIAMPPAIPTNLTLGTYYDIGSAPLIWSKNTEGDILRYDIYGGTTTAPETLVGSTTAPGDTTITITGLTVGTPYFFRIKAVDQGIRASLDYSDEVTTTPAQYSIKTDASALADLYNATGGAGWANNWNLSVALEYVSPSTSTWPGVWLLDGRVVKVYLNNNYITGAIPASIGDLVNLVELKLEGNLITSIPPEINNLTQLTILDLDHNQLVDLPDLTDLGGYVYVEYNRLEFDDILPNTAVLYRYAHQDSVGAGDDVAGVAGTSLTLSVTVAGSNNIYRWMKGTSYMSDRENISGAQTATLTLNPVADSDAGGYVCMIRNGGASLLRLYSRSQHVTVTNLAPAAPQNLVATASGTQVVLTWDANTEGDFLSYRIYSGTTEHPTDWGQDSIAIISEVTKTFTALEIGPTYYYRITCMDVAMNESGFSNEVTVTPALSVSDLEAIPMVFALHQNYPNPFNPTATIMYDLPEIAKVRLVVYDMLGREVITLVDQEQQPAFHRVVWDARNNAGRAMPTGMYFARLVTPSYSKSIRMVLLK